MSGTHVPQRYRSARMGLLRSRRAENAVLNLPSAQDSSSERPIPGRLVGPQPGLGFLRSWEGKLGFYRPFSVLSLKRQLPLLHSRWPWPTRYFQQPRRLPDIAPAETQMPVAPRLGPPSCWSQGPRKQLDSPALWAGANNTQTAETAEAGRLLLTNHRILH